MIYRYLHSVKRTLVILEVNLTLKTGYIHPLECRNFAIETRGTRTNVSHEPKENFYGSEKGKGVQVRLMLNGRVSKVRRRPIHGRLSTRTPDIPTPCISLPDSWKKSLRLCDVKEVRDDKKVLRTIGRLVQ